MRLGAAALACMLAGACGDDAAPPAPPAGATPTKASPTEEAPPPVPGRVAARGLEDAPAVTGTPPAREWEAESPIRLVAVRGDGTLLVKDDAAITVLDAAGNRALRRFARAWGWSPDAEWVIGPAGDDSAGGIAVWDADRAGPDAVIRGGRRGEHGAIAPGGMRLAIQSGSRVDLVDRDEGARAPIEIGVGSEPAPVFFVNEEVIAALTPEHATLFAFPTGERLRHFPAPSAYLANGWRVWRDRSAYAVARAWEVEQIKSLDVPGEVWTRSTVGGPAVDRAGDRIAFTISAGAPRVVVCSLDTGACDLRWPGVGGPLAWSPDGTRLVAGSGTRVRILDVAARREI